MNNLTIQINSLEALERLIGGDAQVEVEVRNSVVQKFAEKHLKPLANSDVIKSEIHQIKEWIKSQVQTNISKEIATYKTDCWGRLENVKLKEEVQTVIDQRVRETIDKTVREAVDNSLKFWSQENNITTRIKQRMDYYTKEMINDEIRKRLEAVKASL